MNSLIVPPEVYETGANGTPEEVVRSKGVDTHISTHRDELWTRKIVEGEVVVKEFGDVDDVGRGGRLAGGADFSEELLEGVRTKDVYVRFETGFAQGFLKELGHLESHPEELALFLFLNTKLSIGRDSSRRGCTDSSKLVLKGRGKHVGEQLECDREKQLHEGYNDECSKGNKLE